MTIVPVLADRPDDPLGGLADARQRLGVVQAAELRLEEGDGLFGLFDPAVDQQLGDQRGDPALRLRAWIWPESNGLSRQRVVITVRSFRRDRNVSVQRESRQAGAGRGPSPCTLPR